MAAVFLFVFSFLGWWFSDSGQIQQVRWDLEDLTEDVSDRNKVEIVKAFLQDNNFSKAFKITTAIENPSRKGWAINAIAEASIKLEDDRAIAKILKKVLDTANTSDNSNYFVSSKTTALRAIAEASIKLEDDRTSIKILKLALNTADAIDDSRYKASAIQSIARAYIKLEDTQTPIEILNLALNTASTIDDSRYKAKAITAIATTHKDLGNWKPMLEIRKKCPTKECEIDVLTLALTVRSQQQNPTLADSKNQ